MSIAPKRQRLKLNEDEIATEEGAKFLTLLTQAYHEGINEEVVRRLGIQLEGYRASSIPGIQRMINLMDAVLSDGKVEAFELMQVKNFIYHLVPSHLLADNQAQHSNENKRDFTPHATERQLAYLEALTGERPSGLSMQEASDRISEEIEGATGLLSHRQKMVVQFWNIEFTGGQCTKEKFSALLDNFYSEDPARKRAWELYKSEFGDNPKSIPLGIGATYLDKIKLMDDSVQKAILHRALNSDEIIPTKEASPEQQWNKAFIIITLVIVFFGILVFIGVLFK